MKRVVTVKFDIIADKLDNGSLKKIVEQEIKNIAPTLISNIRVDIIYTNTN